MWVNKRSEMWGTMRDWLKTASIGSDSRTSVQDDKDLKQDLVGPTYKPNSIGSIMLESKDSMKKRGLSSPDVADSLAITFAYPVSATGRSKKENTPIRTFVGRFTGKSGDASWMR